MSAGGDSPNILPFLELWEMSGLLCLALLSPYTTDFQWGICMWKFPRPTLKLPGMTNWSFYWEIMTSKDLLCIACDDITKLQRSLCAFSGFDFVNEFSFFISLSFGTMTNARETRVVWDQNHQIQAISDWTRRQLCQPWCRGWTPVLIFTNFLCMLC